MLLNEGLDVDLGSRKHAARNDIVAQLLVNVVGNSAGYRVHLNVACLAVEVIAKWVCSVCEGALLLARAGLLDGHKATTHWAFVDCLRRFPAIEVAKGHPRFVESGNRLTGGGISSGLDEALHLISRLFDDQTAVEVQITTQYFPVPPVAGRIPSEMPTCMVQW
ncbi:MAG: hypothetical protein EOS39_11540 [Mesorhizobium sp.]|nr:MAG: hypothetical protein EOS39_11540 [Mesorhizobium sp.]TIV55084.1 MAG: hypothetical protein E5V88_02860 [Mesorhizobium sp.]